MLHSAHGLLRTLCNSAVCKHVSRRTHFEDGLTVIGTLLTSQLRAHSDQITTQLLLNNDQWTISRIVDSDEIATGTTIELAYDPITIRYKIVTLLYEPTAKLITMLRYKIVTLLYELITNKLSMTSLASP